MSKGILSDDDSISLKYQSNLLIFLVLINRSRRHFSTLLLPDRESGTLADWLKEHPEVRVVSRDKADVYAMGASNGAPQAIHVADRFHLLMNLGEVIKKMLQAKGRELKEAIEVYNNPNRTRLPDQPGFQKKDLHIESQEMAEINPVKQHKFEKVKELHKKVYKIRAISRTLNTSRNTVRKYIRMD